MQLYGPLSELAILPSPVAQGGNTSGSTAERGHSLLQEPRCASREHKCFPALLGSPHHPVFPILWVHRAMEGDSDTSPYTQSSWRPLLEASHWQTSAPWASMQTQWGNQPSDCSNCPSWRQSADKNPLTSPYFPNVFMHKPGPKQSTSKALGLSQGRRAEHMLWFSKGTSSQGCSLAASITRCRGYFSCFTAILLFHLPQHHAESSHWSVDLW